MSRRLLTCTIPAVALTATLSACTAQRTPEVPKGFSGEKLAVAQVIAGLSKDAGRFNAKALCSQFFSPRLVMQIRRSSGKTCEQALRSRIAQGDRFDLTTKSVTVDDTTATAVVTTKIDNDKSVTSTLTFAKSGNRWQLDKLG